MRAPRALKPMCDFWACMHLIPQPFPAVPLLAPTPHLHAAMEPLERMCNDTGPAASPAARRRRPARANVSVCRRICECLPPPRPPARSARGGAAACRRDLRLPTYFRGQQRRARRPGRQAGARARARPHERTWIRLSRWGAFPGSPRGSNRAFAFRAAAAFPLAADTSLLTYYSLSTLHLRPPPARPCTPLHAPARMARCFLHRPHSPATGAPSTLSASRRTRSPHERPAARPMPTLCQPSRGAQRACRRPCLPPFAPAAFEAARAPCGARAARIRAQRQSLPCHE